MEQTEPSCLTATVLLQEKRKIMNSFLLLKFGYDKEITEEIAEILEHSEIKKNRTLGARNAGRF